MPIPANIFCIRFRLASFSSNNIATGIHKGQRTCAKNKKIYVAMCSTGAKKEFVKDNHTKPSENCCTANIIGILANIICDFECILLIDATPIAVKTTPAPKLAVVEKHMSFYIINGLDYYLLQINAMANSPLKKGESFDIHL